MRNKKELKVVNDSPQQIDEMNSPLTLEALIVGVLYSAGQTGRDISELRKAFDLDTSVLKQKIADLMKKMDADPTSGLMIRIYGSKYKLLTKVDVKKVLSKLFKIKSNNPLSKRVLEVLVVIAYNQPCTRQMISSIRGSDSSLIVEHLLELGLVREIGRQDSAGRPFIYEVTQMFYDLFGINDISQLPKVSSFNEKAYKELDLFASDYDE